MGYYNKLTIKSMIKYIGIEFEGCWEGEPIGFKGDGSVYFSDYNEEDYYVGEVASKPNNFKGAINFINSCYPDHVNGTCGCHTHLSFTTNYAYQRLMSKKFFDEFIDALEKWGKDNRISNKEFWNRLKGNNSYCKRKFNPKHQVHERGHSGDRYCFINYCWSMHKTLEIRVLPMFRDKEICKKAIYFIVMFINKYLNGIRKKRKKIVHVKVTRKIKRSEIKLCV